MAVNMIDKLQFLSFILGNKRRFFCQIFKICGASGTASKAQSQNWGSAAKFAGGGRTKFLIDPVLNHGYITVLSRPAPVLAMQCTLCFFKTWQPSVKTPERLPIEHVKVDKIFEIRFIYFFVGLPYPRAEKVSQLVLFIDIPTVNKHSRFYASRSLLFRDIGGWSW